MSMCRDSSRVIGRGCLPWPVCSLGKILLSLPYFILCSKAKLACYSRYLVTSYFCIPIPCDEQDVLFLVLILGVLYRTDQLQLLQHQWLGQRFGLLWYWMVWLETNQDHSVIFTVAPKYCISDSFVDYEGYSISSMRFLPTVVDIMVIWIKFTHSHPF